LRFVSSSVPDPIVGTFLGLTDSPIKKHNKIKKKLVYYNFDFLNLVTLPLKIDVNVPTIRTVIKKFEK
jgi:hypothetical protein